MYGGSIMEYAPVSEIFRHSRNPIPVTLKSLLSPKAKNTLNHTGQVPTFNLPAGCKFHPRCDM
jgi:ABC-type dipeptide/oligopeptide/nickel transport system ATPase component